MPRFSYLVKLLLLLLAFVILLEATSYLASRLVIREAVRENARHELLRGGEVFEQLLRARAEQLALSVSVLTDDFGFKDAVASGDAETIRSALINHSARVNADIAIVINPRGEFVTSTVDLQTAQSFLLAEMHREAARSGNASASMLINQRPYQFVVAPIRAPLTIGLAGVGFEIEDTLTASLKRLTSLDVSFIGLTDGSVDYLSGTLDSNARKKLLETLQKINPEPGKVWEVDGMMTLIIPVAQQPHKLVAILQVPLTQVLQPFARLNAQLLWLAIIFSMCAAGLAFILARNVTRPVRLLAESAKRIGAGFYETIIPIKSRDELGDLANAFIHMQVAIGERQEKIIHQLEHDTLTSLPNRSRVFPELEQAIKRATISDTNFAVLIIDIQNFTQINDELTQEIGDQVLLGVAQRIASVAQRKNNALRLGSDEFLLLSEETSTEKALEVAEALHQLFQFPLKLGELRVNVDLHIGIALYPQDARTREEIMRRAGLALHNGRIHKKNTCLYQGGWDENHLRRLSLFRDFQPSLASQQISLSYQPKISLRDPLHLGAEALVRWNHPRLGFINPEEFIAIIESAGQINLLTRWVLKTAIIQNRNWLDAGINLPMSVNLSALDLLVDDLPDYVDQLLTEHKVPAKNLCLEITESAIMREAERSLRNLHRFEHLGILLSIDDFGTGYSSLSQLKKLPVTELKIDKSFILNLATSEDDQLIVRSTIDLGHTLGLSITAEGVETQAILHLLKDYGCDMAQGYLYSRPLPPKEFIEWVKKYQEHLNHE